jgi:hypothetical protein
LIRKSRRGALGNFRQRVVYLPQAPRDLLLGDAACEARENSRFNFVRPYLEGLQRVWPKRCCKRDIGCVAAARDRDASDAWHIVAGIEGEPAPIEKDFEPRIIIHRSWIRRHPDVAQKAIDACAHARAAARFRKNVGLAADNAKPMATADMNKTIKMSAAWVTGYDSAMVWILAGCWRFKAGRRKFIDCCALRPCLWPEIGATPSFSPA